MISKQRLTELIEQGATIWCPYYMFDEEGIQLDNKDYIDGEILYVVNEVWKDNFRKQPLKLEYLFETEEDARWELEMTATRTETLRLPTWEEVKNKKFHFSYLINVKGLYLYINIYNFTKKFEIYCNHGVYSYDYKFNRTFDLRDKEQYKTACKLCLRLFKGEEV